MINVQNKNDLFQARDDQSLTSGMGREIS